MLHRNIIVIGSSHGGTDPMMQIVRKLSPDLPASVFIVRHIPPDGSNYLVGILAQNTPLKVISAAHCEAMRRSKAKPGPGPERSGGAGPVCGFAGHGGTRPNA